MRAALTFDDGPSEWTGRILDLLNGAGAAATFFVVGQRVDTERGRMLVRRMHYEGHEVGNHTYSHTRVTAMLSDDLRSSLLATSDAITHAGAPKPTLWRAPHFDTDQRTTAIARDLGMRHVACQIDPGDWADSDPEAIYNRVARLLSNKAIIDLHDGIPPDGGTGTDSRQPTVDAVQMLLDEPGVEFVTVSAL